MDKHKARLVQIQEILNANPIDLKKLKECCKNGGCPNESIRSVVWKILLDYLPCDKTKWETCLKNQRQNYKDYVQDIIIRPGYKQKEDDQNELMNIDHPLNANPNSEWSSYFKDNETLLQIDKDVRRLCPDLSFFQKPTEHPSNEITQQQSLRKRVANTQLRSHEVYINRYGITSLTAKTGKNTSNNDLDNDEYDMNEYKHLPDAGQEAHWEVVERILFIFAKLNPGQSYVQGMNEICAPLYYTFATDHDHEWRKYAEADCFYCFTNLMGVHCVRDNFVQVLDNSDWGISANMRRLYELLRLKDPDVHRILTLQQLKPEFFAFRWLTLLLSQEFDLPDVISIWDALFSDKNLFDFLLYICCGMIILQRDIILSSDFSTNIKILQNYPSIDIHLVLEKAHQLRDYK